MNRAFYGIMSSKSLMSADGKYTNAVYGFLSILFKDLEDLKPDYIAVAFDLKAPTHRHKMYKEYKGTRHAMPQELAEQMPVIKEVLKTMNIAIIEKEGYEADDVIGTISKQASDAGHYVTILSGDRDNFQLASDKVTIRIPRTKMGKTETEDYDDSKIIEEYGVKPVQLIQVKGLMGDTSDNIPGVPGVGEKTAQKLISEFGSIENLLEHTDQLKGALKTKVETNREMITFSKFLATIKIDVPIQLDMDSLVREQADEDSLRQIFEELEFRTLIDRVLKKENAGNGITTPTGNKTAAEKSNLAPLPLFPEEGGAVQGDLFANFTGNEPGEAKNSNLATLETLNCDYQLIDTEEKRTKIIQKLLTSKILSLDTETTGTEPMDAELVGMSFSIAENEAFYVPVPSDRDEALKIVKEFRPVFENENSLKVGQNIKYDMIVLQNYGATVKGPLFDTMIAHYVLQPELRHGMDYLAEIYLHYQTIHIDELIGPKGKNQKNMRDLDPKDVYLYACEDADVTLKLKNVLEKELKENDAERLFYDIEMPLVPVLVNIERNGVLLDTEALKQSSAHFTAQMEQIEKEIYELAGETFNIASPKQVGEVLFDKLKIVEKAKKTKTGQYVTSEEVLESLRHKHPVVEKILEHRGLKKLLGTYIDALPQLINPRTGRVHTSFNQTVTATGRLSSSNPNLQNIPIRDENGKEIRKAFIPDEGCLFFSADYSQIELRIMAHLSEDKNMIDAFLSNHDIHAATAAKVYKIDLKDVGSDMRRKAKTANFGIIYGISVFGLAERMNVDRKEAKELIDGYFETYPGVKAYMDKSIQVAQEKGYVETIFHRKRFLPDINSRNAVVRGYAERNAINAPIQGSAADIIKVAMARIYQRFQTEGIQAKMILQVHDELNFSVPVNEKERVEEIVIEEMEKAYRMHVPLKADCGWGKNWLEAH